MTVRPKGNKYQADFMIKDVRYRKSFDTKDQAEAWELETRAKLLRGEQIVIPDRAGNGVSLGIMGNLLDYVKKTRWNHLKDGTYLAHRAEEFVAFVGYNTPAKDALTIAVIGSFMLHCMTQGRSPATVNRFLSGISVLCKVAHSAAIIPSKLEMPWQKEGNGRLRFFTKEQVAQIVATAFELGYRREASLFQFLAYTGLRLGEAKRLKWSEIGDTTITVWVSKNDQPRTIGISKEAREALDWVSRDTDGPYQNIVNSTLYLVWGQIRTILELGPEYVIHTFRHSRASWFAQAGVDVVRIQKWMGHRNIQTTLRYAHLAPRDVEELANL